MSQSAQGPGIGRDQAEGREPAPAENRDGHRLRPPDIQTPQCPYLSLRYFEERDSYLFYGRDEHVRELLSKLELNRFVAVLGSSGCGKSSLVRAGLLPELKSGMIPAAGHRWKVIEFKPGSSPLEELGRAFERGLGVQDATETISEGPLGIARAVDAASLEEGTNVLIIADQFEEIFSYLREEQTAGRGAAAQEQARALVRRLLDAAAEPGLRIYVLMVMRSDYLGDCVQFPDLPERMNASLYLVPRLRRDQLQRAIEAPVGRDIEPAVVQRLLAEVGTDPDQLPRLQHLLSRMWHVAAGERITLAHYAAAGGWKNGLQLHLDQIYDGMYEGLAPAQHEACRLVFQRLSEMDRGRAVRRWATRAQLVALCGPEAEDVVNRFHREGFLRLSGRNQDTFDVMHESVLRGWPRLVKWMEEENHNLGRLREMVRVAHEAGWQPGMTAPEKSAVQGIAGLTLRNLVDWRNKFHPTDVWASRYIDAGEFQTALDFVNWSEARALAARLRTWALVTALLLIALAAAIGGFLWKRHEANEEARVSQSYELAVDSSELRGTDPERGVLLAMHAANTAMTYDLPSKRAATTALHTAILLSQVRQTLQGHTDKVESIVFSPDGRLLATGSDDETAKIWDAATGKELKTLSGHGGAIQSVAFSPDGKRLAAAGDDKTAKIWDVETGALLKTLSGHGGAIQSVAFSPDGRRLATAGDDKTAKIWDAATGKEMKTLSGHTGEVESVAFSPDGKRLATGSNDTTAKIWDLDTGKVLTLRGHTDKVEAVAFNFDGSRLATGSDDKTAIIWDAQTGMELMPLRGHEAKIESVAFSPDGMRLATASWDNTAKIWNLGGNGLTTLRGYNDRFEAVAFSPDGKRLATASDNKTAKIWDAEPGGTELLTLPENLWASSVAYSPDGRRIVTGSNDKTAKIWDAETGEKLMTLSGHTDWVFSVAFSPDGKHVATASGKSPPLISTDTTAKIWNLETCKVPICTDAITLRGHTAGVLSVAYSLDGKRLATGSADNTAIIWNAETGKPLLPPLRGHLGAVRSLAFSPDGRFLATASEDKTAKIWIWDAKTGKELLALRGHDSTVYSIAFSPDGKRVATASADGTAKIWDLDNCKDGSCKELRTLRGHLGAVYALAFSPDGKQLATGSLDTTTKVWDVESGKELMSLRGHQGEVRSVAFSPDNKRLATAGADATVQVYALDLHDLLTLARSRVTRGLTAGECLQYFGSSTCPM